MVLTREPTQTLGYEFVVADLPEHEMQIIDDAVNSLRAVHATYMDDRNERRTAEAVMKLSELGNKIFPYLREKLTGNDSLDDFIFAEIVDTLAEVEDIDFVLDCINSERIYADDDLSASATLCKTVNRIAVDIRKADSNDSRLETIAQVIKKTLDDPLHPSLLDSDLLNTLAATGTQEAKDYINNSDNETVQQIKGFLLNIVDDIEEAGWHIPNRSLVAKAVAIDIWEEAVELEEAIALCDKVNDIVKGHTDLPDTLHPVVKLHLYNYMTKHPGATSDDIEQQFLRLGHLAQQERVFSDPQNPFPTIGIEAECPFELLNYDNSRLLTLLDVSNYKEIAANNPQLWEVNPKFSYSPWAQARILQELVEFGAIPIKETDGRNTQLHRGKEDLISLHVNLGAPPEFTTEMFDKYKAETDLLTDVLTYGYSSPERLRLRKTNVSHVGTKDTVQSSAKSKNARTSELIRLEIRSGEFRDFPTYRMIAESQRLGAMMFAYMKRQEHMPMTEQEIELANLWDEFSQEATQELQPIINGRPTLYDWEKDLAANLVETTDIKHICRETGTKYSTRAAKVLEEVH